MHREMAEIIHETIDTILQGGGDREIQIYVDDAALSRVAVEVREAMDALQLAARVCDVPEGYGNTDAGCADVEDILTQAAALAEELGFSVISADDGGGLKDFDDAAFCPACGWHMDNHDMRQFDKRTGELGECPERLSPSAQTADAVSPLGAPPAVVALIEEAADAPTLDDAARVIQDALGVKEGDRAAAFFSDVKDAAWLSMRGTARRLKLWGYLAEEAQARGQEV